MSIGKQDAAVSLDSPADSNRTLRQWWSVVTALLVVAIFAQAVFAGLMLSGVDWGRTAHSANAIVLIAATLTAGLAAVMTLRGIPHGTRLGLTLLSLAAVVIAQAAIGKSSVAGANLMWVHIPLGVALVGLATQAVAAARRLGGE